MIEKKTNMIKVMVTDKEKEEISNIVAQVKEKGYQPNLNVSDLMRQAVRKWIHIFKKIEDGNVLCFMPSAKDISDNKKSMIELEELSRNENLSDHTRLLLSEMSDRIEFEVLRQLQEKYPDHKGFFNISK